MSKAKRDGKKSMNKDKTDGRGSASRVQRTLNHLAKCNNIHDKSRAILMMIAIALIVLLVVIFSMIVIYNIFQISLVRKMQEYGRIKAIGASAKQIKKLINREGMMLALPSIPLGALLGYLFARLSFDWLLSSVRSLQGINATNFHFFSAWAVLGSMVTALITVWLAIARPKRMIARISPIEAMDYREGQTGSQRKKRGKKADKERRTESFEQESSGKETRSAAFGLRKGHMSVDEKTLALANISSNKRQTLTTILTMGLSCVMLVVMMNCLGNIDVAYEAKKEVPHGQFELSLDYTFYDNVYPEDNLDTILGNNPINEELLEELRGIEGVTEVTTRDYLVICRGVQKEAVNVLSREDFDFERDKGAAVGNLDYELVSQEDQLIYGWSHFMEECGIDMETPVSYVLWDGSSEKEYSSYVGGSFGSLTGGWAITEDTYRHFGYRPGSHPGKVWIDCAEKDRAYVEEQIRKIMRSRQHLELETLEKNLQEQKFGSQVMRYGIYSLLTIIAFIGFMNMANTMIISITTRKREYGIMQAVGMTGRQLSRSLILQGVIYVAGIMIVSLVVGIPLGYLAFVKFKAIQGFGMNVYHFPWRELLLMAAVLLILQLILARILSGNLKKDSLVERIRY